MITMISKSQSQPTTGPAPRPFAPPPSMCEISLLSFRDEVITAGVVMHWPESEGAQNGFSRS
jgi:hypothetical protein